MPEADNLKRKENTAKKQTTNANNKKSSANNQVEANKCTIYKHCEKKSVSLAFYTLCSKEFAV